MTSAAFCHEGDPSSAFGTFSPLRRREGYSMVILARCMVRVAFSPPRGEKVPKADGAPESAREQEGESPFWSNVH